jgi:hypothetical protein
MGARGNIVFKQYFGYVGVYLHWDGHEIREKAMKAIKRVANAGRLNDEGYATRIAISEIVGDYWKDDLGYGIYVGNDIEQTIADNEFDIIVIDWNKQRLEVYNEGRYNTPKESYSFEEL